MFDPKGRRLSPTLKLAQEWATQLGNEVSVLDGLDPTGKPISLLQVKHGALFVVVVDRGRGVVEIDCPQDIPQAFSERAAALPDKTKLEAWITFRQQLMNSLRCGFSVIPPNASALHLVRRWVVTQMVLLQEDDPSTFNRFADAIQEVVNTFFCGASVLGAIMRDPAQGSLGGTGVQGSTPPPPGRIYG